MRRCDWCGSDPLYVTYHDTEWGVPSHDDRHLFEMLILEGAQAGLSWITILRKREAYREALTLYSTIVDFTDTAISMRRVDRRLKQIEERLSVIRNDRKNDRWFGLPWR